MSEARQLFPPEKRNDGGTRVAAGLRQRSRDVYRGTMVEMSMNELEQQQNEAVFDGAPPIGLPARFSEIENRKHRTDVRHLLREALSNDKVCDKLAPYMVDGGICGHKVLDYGEMIDIVMQWDASTGKRIFALKLKKAVLCDKLRTVLRERYQLDKRWKVVGISTRAQIAQH